MSKLLSDETLNKLKKNYNIEDSKIPSTLTCKDVEPEYNIFNPRNSTQKSPTLKINSTSSGWIVSNSSLVNGTSGTNNLNPGIIYAPYIPLINTNTLAVDAVVYDDSDEMNNVKISDKFPRFSFGSVVDEVLDDFGGVLEIIQCVWDESLQKGKTVCLLKDWTVFVLELKSLDYVSLDHAAKKTKINHDCEVLDDIEEWIKWEDSSETRLTLKEQQAIKNEENMKRKSALDKFFSGDVSEMSELLKAKVDL